MKNNIDKKKLINNFSFLTSSEEKYLYIIELGNLLSVFPKKFYKKENLVFGCQSQVWIKLKKNKDNTIMFLGTSDTLIVKGLISIIFILYRDIDACNIIDFNIFYWLKKISLEQYLTSSRAQGLEQIIKFIHVKLKSII